MSWSTSCKSTLSQVDDDVSKESFSSGLGSCKSTLSQVDDVSKESLSSGLGSSKQGTGAGLVASAVAVAVR